jgi:hypothetical protein
MPQLAARLGPTIFTGSLHGNRVLPNVRAKSRETLSSKRNGPSNEADHGPTLNPGGQAPPEAFGNVIVVFIVGLPNWTAAALVGNL